MNTYGKSFIVLAAAFIVASSGFAKSIHVNANGHGLIFVEAGMTREELKPNGTGSPWVVLPDGTRAAVDTDVDHLLPVGVLKVYTTAAWSRHLSPDELTGAEITIEYAPLPADYDAGWRDTYLDRQRVDRVLDMAKGFSCENRENIESYFFGIAIDYAKADQIERARLKGAVPTKPVFKSPAITSAVEIPFTVVQDGKSRQEFLRVRPDMLVAASGKIELGNYYFPVSNDLELFLVHLDPNRVEVHGSGVDLFKIAAERFADVQAIELHASNNFTSSITGSGQGTFLIPDLRSPMETLEGGGGIFIAARSDYVGARQLGAPVAESISAVNTITVFLK